MIFMALGRRVPLYYPININLFTLSVNKQERNFLLSPITMTLLIRGTSSLIASSIGTGGIFSPPAVIISSVGNKMRNKFF